MESNISEWKIKFIEDVMNNKIITIGKNWKEIIAQLEKLHYPKFSMNNEKKSYDYLISIPNSKFSGQKMYKSI